jgi:hypothetical protein
MGKFLKMFFMLLFAAIIFNVLVVSSTLLLHEAGHFLTGLVAGCQNIKLIIFDSVLGTYTEMNCPSEQSTYFPLMGALVFTLPFSFLLLILSKFPEKNFFWIGLGFNLVISVADFPQIVFMQLISFIFGLALIVIGEVLLIDKLILVVEGS